MAFTKSSLRSDSTLVITKNSSIGFFKSLMRSLTLPIVYLPALVSFSPKIRTGKSLVLRISFRQFIFSVLMPQITKQCSRPSRSCNS